MRDRTLWTWHIVAGVLIFGLLGMHMTIMHLDDFVGVGNPTGGPAISWSNVAARAQSLGTAISYVLLLGFALFHGLYGLRNILLELGPRPATTRLLQGVIVVAGLALFALGTWAAFAAIGGAA